jgi:OOP family OmpA-OmpF porin
VNVRYDKALDPMEGLPTPQECLERLQSVQAQHKISFDPGSAALDAASFAAMGALAQALKNCTAIKMEIGGHTDAQGSTQGNLALSQARAEAVLMGLLNQQADVSGMRAVGYGERLPIADNATEAGRETNRRIEFTLIKAAIGAVPNADAKSAVETAPDGTPLAPEAPTIKPPARPKG